MITWKKILIDVVLRMMCAAYNMPTNFRPVSEGKILVYMYNMHQ